MDLRGQRIHNRYLLGALLGEGVDALVYCAMDCHLGRVVAIKLLRPELTADPTLVTRFEREARGASRLNHPNIVPIYDYGQALGTYYLVMEYVRGGNLGGHLHTGHPLAPEAALALAAPIADALGAAHARGVVHRDVKPANVLLTEDGYPKLTDFGIAKLLDVPAVTRASAVLGTAHYLAPEQATGGEITPATDVYALGVVLYEMLAGRRPFLGRGLVQVAMQHVHVAPPPLTRLNPAVSASLAGLVARALAKDPALRFADGTALAEALREEARPRARPPTVVIVPAPIAVPLEPPLAAPKEREVERPVALPQRLDLRSYAVRQRRGGPATHAGMMAAGLGLMLGGLLTAGTLHGDPAGPAVDAFAPAAEGAAFRVSEAALVAAPPSTVASVPPQDVWEQAAKPLVPLEDVPAPLADSASPPSTGTGPNVVDSAPARPMGASVGASIVQASRAVAVSAPPSAPPAALTGSVDSPRSAPASATLRVASVSDRGRPAPAVAPTLGTAAPAAVEAPRDEDVKPVAPPPPPAAVEAPPPAPAQAEQPKPQAPARGQRAAAESPAPPPVPWGMPPPPLPPPMLGPWGPRPPVLAPIPPGPAHRQFAPSALNHRGPRR
jgi:hypothetical protein